MPRATVPPKRLRSSTSTSTSTSTRARRAVGRPLEAAEPGAVLERLERAMPEPKVELDHRSPWELLVATILSAQSTDRTVNRVTPELFRRFPNPRALGAASQEEVEAVVKPTGFFRNKAKAIREASKQIVEQFNGSVPRTMDALTTLPGVARKTANVVLGTAYGVAAGIVVDTHAGRVARRLGLTAAENPEDVEAALCALFPEAHWIGLGVRLVLHGRYVCVARKPRCEQCPLNELCPSRESAPAGDWAARARWERQVTEGRGESPS